jgi:hypothetical protein
MLGSAPNINNVILVGKLTAGMAVKQTPDGRSVCELRLAIDDQRDSRVPPGLGRRRHLMALRHRLPRLAATQVPS